MANRDDVVRWCSERLGSDHYQDLALNGLQIEGREEINRVALAVSANQRTIDASVEWNADALLVHHGLILNHSAGPIHGYVRNRLRALLCNDINLIGFHLPLDGHPELGNNAQLAHQLGWNVVEQFAEIAGNPIGLIVEQDAPVSIESIEGQVKDITGFQPMRLEGRLQTVQRMAIVSGSGYSTLDEAAALGCDLLLTGDVREPTMAFARELDIGVLVAGHEATERLGVQALAEELANELGIEYRFIDDPNPF